jgi:uncharacterized protein involved in exopolysaccharide biosynthesis
MKKTLNNNLVSSSDLIWLVNCILKYWYLYIIIIPIFSIIGILYNHKQVRQYQTKIEILLKTNEIYNYQDNLNSNLGFYNYYGDISNQKRIIGSYDIIKKVTDKLDLSCSYYIVGRLKTTEIFNKSPFKVTTKIFNHKLYQVPVKFKILSSKKYTLKYKIDNIDYEKVHFFDSTEVTNHYSIKSSLGSFLKLHKNKSFSEIDYEIMFYNENYWINRIKSNLTIENLDYTTLLIIKLNDTEPKRSQMVLDTLAKEYINYTLENQFTVNANTSVYVKKQIKDVTKKIDSLNLILENFKSKIGIVDVGKESEKTYQKLIFHESNLNQLRLEEKSFKNLKDYITNNKYAGILPPSLFINNDTYLSKIINEFYQNQLKQIEMKQGVKSGHFDLEGLKVKILNQKRDIVLYIENSLYAINREMKVEESEILYYESKIKKIPGSKRDLASIQRKILVNEKLYDFLLEKKASISLAKSGIIPQTKIIEKARTIGSFGGDNRQNILLFSISGLILSIIISIVLRLFF